MKKLLVKLALRVLKRFSVQPVKVELGQRFFYHGRAFAITTTTMDVTPGRTSLTIKCVEDGDVRTVKPL